MLLFHGVGRGFQAIGLLTVRSEFVNQSHGYLAMTDGFQYEIYVSSITWAVTRGLYGPPLTFSHPRLFHRPRSIVFTIVIIAYEEIISWL